MSKRVYCMDNHICDKSCNIADFYCNHYNTEWPPTENCGCPPNTHWGFNHDQRETPCLFQESGDVSFHPTRFSNKIVIKHSNDSQHCEACARLLNHIAGQMIINKGGVVDIAGIKIKYDHTGNMTMV